MSAPPPISLEEARRRLKELGYLDGRVERFLFRRAFEGRRGLLLPAALFGALAAAVASVAAVESSEPAFGGALGAAAALAAHLLAADLLAALLAAAVLTLAADRSRAPGGAAATAGLAVALSVLGLWAGGVWGLSRAFSARALVWGVPVAALALLAAAAARSGFLARAYAHSRVLPSRRRRGVLAATAAIGLAGAVAALALRREPLASAPPRPSPRPASVVVIAVDGLDLPEPGAPGSGGIDALLARGACGWWPGRPASPPEVWTDLATGMPASRHGVRALERVRPAGSPLALRPPFGTFWYFKRLGPALGLVRSAPVSAADRRSLTFWEVAASAGLPSEAVGWWASGRWPGAAVVSNEEVLAGASGGLEVDERAIGLFEERARGGERIRTVYLPGPDILRGDPAGRRLSVGQIGRFLSGQAQRAAAHGDTLVVLAADSHRGGFSRMVAFEPGGGARTLRIRPEDVAPSILARAGIPVARDLPGRPAAPLFLPGSLETSTVETYGPRLAPEATRSRASDREYLEKLKSLGYLN